MRARIPRTPSLPDPTRRAPPRAQARDLDADAAARAGHRLAAVPALRLSDAAEPLPHLDTIQRSFGAHDVGGVRAHRDAGTRAAARKLGAAAFTAGEHVGFARAPSLRVAAHEAAHVVQQRAGADGGAGWERHADAVAERVASGRSAAPLLDSLRPSSGAAPALQLFKDADHRQKTIESFNACKPDDKKAVFGLMDDASLTHADRLDVVKQADWLKADQKTAAGNFFANEVVHRQIDKHQDVLKKDELTTAHATVELFEYLSRNAERFTEGLVEKIQEKLEECKKSYEEMVANVKENEEPAYQSVAQLVNSELLGFVEKEMMEAVKKEIPNAKDKGLIIPIVEFAENAGFFYDDITGKLIPEASEQWASAIQEMLRKGQEVLHEAAHLDDGKRMLKFVKSLAAGGCFPARSRVAEEGIKPEVKQTMQSLLGVKLQGAEEDQVEGRALHSFVEFFLSEADVDPNAKNVGAQTMERVNSRAFKTWVKQQLQQGLNAKGKPLQIGDQVLDKFIAEQYPFIHKDDVKVAQVEAEEQLVLAWNQMQPRFVEPIPMGQVATMKLPVGTKLHLRADEKIEYEITEIDAPGKKYKLKLNKAQ